MQNDADQTLQQNHRRTVKRLLWVCLGMFAFCFTLIPLYAVFCEITGINGKTGRMDAQLAQHIQPVDRWVTVQFDGSVNTLIPWSFRADQHQMRVRLGELAEAHFLAVNEGLETIIGQAVPSVAPSAAALYVNKTECFCFTPQRLEPSEQRDMLVRFLIDPALPPNIDVLTLSFTVYRSNAPVASPSWLPADHQIAWQPSNSSERDPHG